MNRFALIIVLLTFQFCALAQNWQSIGTRKLNFGVDQLYSDTATGQLYCTGLFWMIDTASAYGLAEWNGAEWQTTFTDPVNNAQKRMVRFQNNYYLTKSPYLFRWNGVNWDTIANVGALYSMYNDGDSVLYVMGGFNSFNSIPASKIVRFDGSTWSALDTTIWNNGVSCAFRYQGQMYFGGLFYNSAMNIWRIARWDGTTWHPVGNGITGSVAWAGCMEEYNGYLYVGGYMEVSQGNPGDFIARWDGTTWTQVGGGMSAGQVNDLEVYNNELWAVGSFFGAGGIPATSVARYDGTDWCSVGVFDNAVSSVEIHNGELYVSGSFFTIDGDSVNKVVKWIGGNFADSCGHLTTAIPESAPTAEVSFYPNPVFQTGTFQFSNSEQRTVSVVDQLGREVWRKETNQQTLEFPASDFTAGIYFFQVIQEGLVAHSGKLVVQ